MTTQNDTSTPESSSWNWHRIGSVLAGVGLGALGIAFPVIGPYAFPAALGLVTLAATPPGTTAVRKPKKCKKSKE